MPSTVDTQIAAPTADRFRLVMGSVPTSVAIVTGRDADGSPAGLTVGTFVSVSLEPLLVGFLPAKNSTSWPVIEPVGTFAVNILTDAQGPLCRSFAASGGDKFEGLSWHPGEATGAPILEGVLCWIECEVEQTFEAGDHDFVVGRVLALSGGDDGMNPLVFYRGQLEGIR